MRLEELQEVINKYEPAKLARLMEGYNKHHALKDSNKVREFNLGSIEQKMIANDIISTCPRCNTSSKYHIVKNGKRGGTQRYKCKDCNVKFSLFTNTLLEKTKYHWDVWVRVMQMNLVHTPLDNMVEILQRDYGAEGLDKETVWIWRLKLAYALSQFPLPELTGVVQIDETHIRESQKGMRELVNFAFKHKPRFPRKGTVASDHGVMGAEFISVVAAISDSGHSITKTLSYGIADYQLFDEIFSHNFRSPS